MEQEMMNFLTGMKDEIGEMNTKMTGMKDEIMTEMNTKMTGMKDDLKSDIENLNFRFRNIQNGVAAASYERDELESFQTTCLVSDPTGFNSKRVIAGKRF